jgi:hypothetical protein
MNSGKSGKKSGGRMNRVLYSGISDDPRITKDMEEPIIWGRCDYCKGIIALGVDYYTDDEKNICMDCVRGFKQKTAERI